MVIKKDLVIAVLATFCLTSALFSIIPTRSSPAKEYNPIADLTGPEGIPDGIINMRDIGYICNLFGAKGTPVNWTKLFEDVDELQSKVNSLNASLVELQSRIAELETELAILNATKLGKPDYDSAWFSITQGKSVILTHNLTTTNVLVYMVGKYSDYASPYIHQHDYGGELSMGNYYGAYWSDLTETTIRVTRQGQDINWNYIRVVIWKIP